MKNSNNLNLDFITFLSKKLQENAFNIIFSLSVIILAFVGIKLSNKAITKSFQKINSTNSKSFRIAIKSAKTGIILACVFLILSKFNIPVNAFFTIISSSLVAAGLALQQFFCNIAKSLQVRAMAPFAIGDLIEIDEKKGRVKKIDYMHTHIVNDEQGLVMVPNALIADKSIINYSRRENKNQSNKND